MAERSKLLQAPVPPAPRLRAGPTTRRAVVQGLGGLAVVAVFLEILTRLDILPATYFPPVSSILLALGGLLTQPSFLLAFGQTLGGWALGLLIAIAIAVPLGLVIGSSVYVYRAVRPLVEFLRPIPSVALIPLAILVFGVDLESKVFLIVFASSWPILINTIYGVQDRDPIQQETVRSYRIRPIDRLLRVSIPAALPFIATGVRISSSVAVILAVTAELVIGAPGLGREITTAQASGALPQMYALIVTTGLIGVAINVGARAIERRLLRWHPSQRSVE